MHDAHQKLSARATEEPISPARTGGHGHHGAGNGGSGTSYPLLLAGAGERVRVVALRGGAALDRRVTQMGINVGAELTVLLREGGGLVVLRGETRFALGGGMAHRIMVAPLDTHINPTR